MITIKTLIRKFKLDPIQDWQTIKVIREILNNENQDSTINYEPNTFASEEKPWEEPQPIYKMIPKFRELFNQGFEILFSHKSYYGDEGGTLLLIYLLKPAFVKPYWQQFDEDIVLPHPEVNPGFFHAMNHLTQNPGQFIEIWAGAY